MIYLGFDYKRANREIHSYNVELPKNKYIDSQIIYISNVESPFFDDLLIYYNNINNENAEAFHHISHLLSNGSNLIVVEIIKVNENINIIHQEIGAKEIAVFRHRMFRLGYNYTEGLFNVGVVYFKNTEFGKKALFWWADAVLHQKHPGLDTCGDQKYLDYFFMHFKEKMFIDGNIGHGAPWHWQLYDLKNVKTRNEIVWENNVQKLIFNHHKTKRITYINFLKGILSHVRLLQSG